MKALLIIAQRGYQDFEYNTPKTILEKAGVEIVTASKEGGACVGKLGGMVKDTIALADVNVSGYDAIVFVGGPGALVYAQDSEAHRIAQEAVEKRKWLAAICIAPIILAHAGVLKGKKATVWNGDAKQDRVLRENGAKYISESVVIDGKIVTAEGPAAAEMFGMKILEMLRR